MFRFNRLTSIALPFGIAMQLATAPTVLAMQNTRVPEIAQHNQLIDKYILAITNDVMSRWHYKLGLVGTCVVQVTQKPGGMVTQATVLPGCSYDDASKQGMIKAVMDASPLPYQGFESVFHDKLNMVFAPVASTSPASPCQAGPGLKSCQQAKVDELFKQLDEAQARTQAARLAARYMETIKEAIRLQFVGPDSMPPTPCLVKIVQKPGGWVVSVSVDQSCPYDMASRHAVEGAVLRAQPFPYKGFESVFSPTLEFQFDPKFLGMSK